MDEALNNLTFEQFAVLAMLIVFAGVILALLLDSKPR